jgi:Ca-activated chloride channel homolog
MRLFLGTLMMVALAAVGCGETAGSGVNFGGAQDIGLFRDILDQGGIPGPHTLDAGGFFAEHRLEMPVADCGANLCAHGLLGLDRTFGEESPWARVLGVGFNSPLALEDLPKPPFDMAVVIDTSGSMQKDDKITYTRDGLKRLIAAMRPEDRLAIVAYAASARRVQPLAFVDAANAAAMEAAVDALEPAGATNLYAGLEEGFLALLEEAEPGRSQLLVLLSDGNPSAGITAPAALEEMVSGYAYDGVVLTTVSVGADADPTEMARLAELTGGNAYHLESVRAVSEVFADELAYFQSVVAWDVRVEVRLGEGYGLSAGYGASYAFDPYLNAAVVRTRSVALASRTDDPDPGQGRRGGGAVFLLDLYAIWDPPEGADLGRVAELHLLYRPVGQEEYVEQVLEVRSPLEPAEEPPDDQPYFSYGAFEKATAMLFLYQGLVGACSAATWNYHYADWLLQGLHARASAWNEARDDADIRADLALVAKLIHNLEALGADDAKYEPSTPPSSSCASPGGPGGSGLGALLGLVLAGLVARRGRL